MSKVIKTIPDDSNLDHFGALVKDRHGQVFYVSSCWTHDCGYETMAFLYDKEVEKVVSWLPLLVKRYPTFYEMRDAHIAILANIEDYLGEGIEYDCD